MLRILIFCQIIQIWDCYESTIHAKISAHIQSQVGCQCDCNLYQFAAKKINQNLRDKIMVTGWGYRKQMKILSKTDLWLKEKSEGSDEKEIGISWRCIFSALPLFPDFESSCPVRSCRCLHASNTKEDNVLGTVLVVQTQVCPDTYY